MVEVKRKKGESPESLLRRFTRRMQLSGTALEFKKHRFHSRTKSKLKRKVAALRRLTLGEKRDYLMRAGLLVEEVRTNARSR